MKYNDASWNLMWYWYNEIKWNIHSLQLCSSNIKETCRAMWNVFVLRVLWTPPWFWQWPLWCRRVLSPGCFVSASTFQTPDSKKNDETVLKRKETQQQQSATQKTETNRRTEKTNGFNMFQRPNLFNCSSHKMWLQDASRYQFKDITSSLAEILG